MNCRYELRMMSDEYFDDEFVIYRLLNFSSEARHFLNISGDASGNEGYWAELESELREFSQSFPQILFLFDVTVDYETTSEERYWFRNGKMLKLEPVLTWPEFREEDMA